MKKKQIRNMADNKRLFDAVYKDDESISLEFKLGRNGTVETVDLRDVLDQIQEGITEQGLDE